MGRHSSVDVLATFRSTGRRVSVPLGGRFHGLGRSNRKPVLHFNIKVGTQIIPRSLVLSFYSILRDCPVVIGALGDSPIQKPRRLIPATPSQHSHLSWPFEQLPSWGCTITTPSASLQYPGLAKRGYNSAVSPSKPPGSRSRKPTSAGEPVDKKDDKSTPPRRSVLHPPKQAPSVWQLFFIDWLQKQKSSESEGKKLNVAREAKEAGHVYNGLSEEDRDALKHRALALKETYEREFTAWKRTLTPADIERENAFRAAQRKSGKSRRKNINDPNAPKRPLTAYFLFLQTIRADPHMVKDVFDDVTESTRQSILAAAKWRGMSDVEKQPYLTQADSAKREYEAVRKEYDERLRSSNEFATTSVLVYPASPGTPAAARESGDGMTNANLHE